MKLRRFLALAVSLVMVLSMVPAFSFTASAATTTAEIPATTDFGWNFTANTTTEAADTVNLVVSWNNQREALMSFAIPEEILAYADQDATVTATLTTKDPFYNNGIGSAPIMTIIALDGDVINNADMAGGANTSAALNEAIAAGTVLGTMDAKASNSVELDVTSVVKSGETNLGLLLTCHGGRGYEQYGIMQFKSPVVTFTAMSNEVAAAQSALNAISLPLATKADLALPTTAGGYDVTWTSDNDAVIDGEGNYTSPEAVTTVALTPSVTVGSEVVYGKTQNVVAFPASRAGSEYNSGSGIYTIGTDNIIATAGTAASFEDAAGNRVLTGWTSHLGGETNAAMDWVDATVDVVPDGNWAYAGWWNDNITHNSNYCTIDTMWPVEAGKYYLSFYAKKPAGGSTTYVYYSTDNAHHRNDASLTSEAWYSLVSPGSDWAKYEYVIEATEAGYIGFTSYNIGNNGNRGTQFDDFELYTAEQAAETLASVPAVGAEVTVIAGNTPVLPATVTGTGTLGSAMEAAVTWDTTGLDFTAAGTVTVPGTVDGTAFTTSAAVTVLEEAFALPDVTTVDGQDAGKAQQVLFPVAISDAFAMEFTANYASFGDLWITIKAADAGFFGPEQLPLGVNASGAFRPVNGNGAGGRTTADADQAYLTAGVDYRFFITTDASTGKYTVSIFNEATGEEVVTVENFGYRTNAAAIEAITSLTNNGAGSVTLTNIKVSSATASALKQEYTVVTLVNGVEESRTTVAAFSVDNITAEERAGYMLTKTVEGNTVTFAYVSTIDVTITYTVNGETIKTVTNAYDPLVSTGAEFEAVTYYANGVNAIYTAEAATYAASQSVELTALANNGTHALGDVIVSGNGTQYEIASANLVPNGDFSLGLTGWYNSANGEAGTDKFTVNGDGTITALTNEGTAGAGSLYRAWAIEPGKTYLFTWTSDVAQEYQKVAVRGDIADTSDTGKTVVGTATGGTNNVVFTAGEADTYVQINFRWLASSNVIGNFGLYEVVPATVTVTEEIASVAEVADVKVFGNDEVVLPATLAVTGTLGSNVNGTVAWDAPATYPAGTTTVTGTLTAQFGTAEPVTAPVSVNVTVIDEFTLEDSLSLNGQPGNVVYFPVAINGEFTMEFDYTINQIKDVSLQMGYNGTLFSAAALGISPNGNVLKVTGGNKAGTGEGIELVNPVAAGDVFHMVLTMDASDDTYSLVVELADGTVVTTGEKGFRTAQDAINTMALLTNGGGAEGDIAISNIKVTADSNVEFCTVTVDGVEKQVIKGRSYKQALTGAALVDADGNLYAPVNGVVTVPVNADMVLATKALGLEMVGGAQVRIGATELEDGAKLDAMADSGLRFLATANYSDTIISMDGVEFGIKVTAEGSDKVAYVPAVEFQNGDDSVFSAAITNLAESNYNRKYTAVAYAKVGDVEITTDGVTRSIYQVSAGIMKNGSADADNAEYTVDGVVKNILNAYLNQAGIRLSVTAGGIAVEEGKYTGDVFFAVESVSDGDDGWNVTITPDTSWGTPAEIAAWWTDYVRFNNNNSVAKTYISNATFADGVLTFNFDKTADDGGFSGEEDPLV